MDSARFAFALLCSATAILAAGRLISIGLAAKYRWFVAALAAGGLQGGIVFWPFNSPMYVLIWHASEPIIIGLGVMSVIELRGILNDRFNTPRDVARKFGVAIMAISIAVSVLCGADLWFASWAGTPFRALHLVSRLNGTALAVACGILAVISRAWRAPVDKNLKIHALLLTAYFGLPSFAMLALLIFPASSSWMSAAKVSMSALIHLGWVLGMTRRGERALKIRPFGAASLARMDAGRDSLIADLQRLRRVQE